MSGVNFLKKIALSIVTVLMLLVAVVPFSIVHAQNTANERITLSPAVSRPTLNAGETTTGKMTIINDGTTSYTFRMYARPFSVTTEAYDPNYTIVNERTEAYQWVQFEKTNLRLEPGARVDVKYTVKTPPNARSGGHYAVLFAETQPPENQPASVARKKRVGTLLYMKVNGTVEERGNIESWQTKPLQTKSPITSELRLKNNGNIHYEANITATYTNLFGKKQFELNQQLLVLPGTTRKVVVSWQNTPYFGIFKAGGNVNYLGKNETLPNQYVVLFPRSLMIGLGVGLGVLLVWTVVKAKRRKSKAKSRAEEEK